MLLRPGGCVGRVTTSGDGGERSGLCTVREMGVNATGKTDGSSHAVLEMFQPGSQFIDFPTSRASSRLSKTCTTQLDCCYYLRQVTEQMRCIPFSRACRVYGYKVDCTQDSNTLIWIHGRGTII